MTIIVQVPWMWGSCQGGEKMAVGVTGRREKVIFRRRGTWQNSPASCAMSRVMLLQAEVRLNYIRNAKNIFDVVLRRNWRFFYFLLLPFSPLLVSPPGVGWGRGGRGVGGQQVKSKQPGPVKAALIKCGRCFTENSRAAEKPMADRCSGLSAAN